MVALSGVTGKTTLAPDKMLYVVEEALKEELVISANVGVLVLIGETMRGMKLEGRAGAVDISAEDVGVVAKAESLATGMRSRALCGEAAANIAKFVAFSVNVLTVTELLMASPL